MHVWYFVIVFFTLDVLFVYKMECWYVLFYMFVPACSLVLILDSISKCEIEIFVNSYMYIILFSPQ